MQRITAPVLSVGTEPSYSRLMPSILFTSTSRQYRRHFHPTVIEAGSKYRKLDEYYQKNSCKFWDNFYKRHKNKVFTVYYYYFFCKVNTFEFWSLGVFRKRIELFKDKANWFLSFYFLFFLIVLQG